jgi:hypothetical protein
MLQYWTLSLSLRHSAFTIDKELSPCSDYEGCYFHPCILDSDGAHMLGYPPLPDTLLCSDTLLRSDTFLCSDSVLCSDTFLCRIPSFARIPSFSPFLCPESRTHCIDCSGPFTLGRFHSVPTHSGLGPAPILLQMFNTRAHEIFVDQL